MYIVPLNEQGQKRQPKMLASDLLYAILGVLADVGRLAQLVNGDFIR